MRRNLLLLLSIIFAISAYSQNKKISQATVDKILNVPVYLYSYPIQEYEETGTIRATWSAIASGLDKSVGISKRTKELINKAKNKKKKGKVSDFNAIIIDPDDYTATLILSSDKSSLNADVKRVSGVPVYIYSYPIEEYEEVKEISATWSALGGGNSLKNRVSELISKAKRKEKKGKIGHFDAIIISPDDFTGILIKFKE